MPYCQFCGEEIEEGLSSCPQCGEVMVPERGASSRRLPVFLHPLAVLGYLVLLSGLLVFLQLRMKAGGTEPPPITVDSTRTVIPKAEEITPQTVNESDKTWMKVYNYEQSLKPIVAALSELDSRLSQPGVKLDGTQVRVMLQKVNELQPKAESLETPASLGPCAMAVRNSVEQMKSAISAFWQFQNSGSKDSEALFNQNLATSKSQLSYCQGIIDNLKKDLEKEGLSKSKSALEKAAPDFFSRFFPAPPPPPPAPEAPLPAETHTAPQPRPAPDAFPQPGPGFGPDKGLRPNQRPGQTHRLRPAPLPEQPPAEPPAEGEVENPKEEPGASPEPGEEFGDSQ